MKELLYVSALHQTCMPGTRANGTVSNQDVKRLLLSRYNLRLNHEQAKTVLRQLGGGVSQAQQVLRQSAVRKSSSSNFIQKAMKKTEKSMPEEVKASEDDAIVADLEEYLDIVQILAILLIPSLVEAVRVESRDAKVDESLLPIPNLIEDGLAMMMKDVHSETWPPVLNEDLIEALLLETGEYERAQQPDLIREMLDMADSSAVLDEDTLARVLTADVSQWEVGSDRRETTIYYDVMGALSPRQLIRQHESSDPHMETETEGPDDAERQKLILSEDMLVDTTVLGHTSVDYVMDAHSSLVIVVITWLFYVTNAFSYLTIFQGLFEAPCLDDKDVTFGCQLVNVLWTWCVL